MTLADIENGIRDSLYVKRNPRYLEPYLSMHMMAMTVEELSDKGDIAMELAWRDKEIDRLKMLCNGRDADGNLMPAEPFVQEN